MKKYNVIEIECEKGASPTDIYEKVTNKFKYHRHLFEIKDLRSDSPSFSASMKKQLQSLDIDKYAFSYVLPHVLRADYFDPEKHTNHVISNLDDCWDYGNPDLHDDISEDKFVCMVDLFRKLKSTQFSTWLLGIDEIEWGGEAVGRGSYGYKKAKGAYDGGKNYLSNSVMLSKVSYGKPNIIVYISCESKYRDLDTVNDLIASLGKKKGEKEYYGPSDDAEREECDKIQKSMDERFERFIAEMPSIISDFPYRLHKDMERLLSFDDKINIRKLVKNILCVDGWSLSVNDPDLDCTTAVKQIGDREFKIGISPQFGGHYLQTLVVCKSPMFFVGDNINYCITADDEYEAASYIENIQSLSYYILQLFGE